MAKSAPARSTAALLDVLEKVRRTPLDQISAEQAREVAAVVSNRGKHHVPVEVARFNSSI